MQDTSNVLRVEAIAGARIAYLNAASSGNRLDRALVAALRHTLTQWETNPAVSFVILRGATDALFSAGADVKELRARVADPATRAEALAFLREQYALHAQLATYTKPIAAAMHGATLGAGYAMAAHTQFPYVTDSSIVGVPEVTAGSVPLGGSSYHLSRLQDGVGMYMALTGACLRGVDAFWAGVTPYYASGAGVAKEIAAAAGELSSDTRLAWRLHEDPVYAKSLQTLRDSRADTKLFHVLANVSEDVSRESFEEYLRLKRWYSHMAAGDRASAAAAYASPEASLTETGDLFDFNQSHALNGRDELAEPEFAAADRRARIAGAAAHAGAVRNGELDDGPSPAALERMRVVKRCFGADLSRGDKVLHVSQPAVQRPRTREEFLRSFAGNQPAALDAGWEARLPESVQSAIMAVYERMGITPVASELPAIANAIRAGVARAWPNGSLTDVALDDLCFSASVPDRRQAKDIVSRGISYLTAALHGLEGREAWLLEDPGLLAREARAAADEAMKRVRRTEDGAELTPRIDANPDGLLYDLNEEDDVFWPIRGTGEAVSDARELEFRLRREDLAPDVALPTRARVHSVSTLSTMRRDALRQLARTPLGASAYPTAVQAAITAIGDGERDVGAAAPAAASNSVSRREARASSTPGSPSPDDVARYTHDMLDSLRAIRVEVLTAARDMAEAAAPAGAAAPSKAGKHVRVGTSATAAAVEFVTDEDIAALARLNLDDPSRLESVQGSLPPQPAAGASEPQETAALRRLVRVWAALRRTVRENGDRRPLQGDALPADVAAAAPSAQAGNTAAASQGHDSVQTGAKGRAGAKSGGAATAAPAAPSTPKFVPVVRLSQEALGRVKAALRTYATAEAFLMGHRLHDILRLATTSPDGNVAAAADEVYVLAKSSADGSIALRRVIPTGPKRAAAPAASGTSTGRADTSPLDAIAPASLPTLASTLPSALSGAPVTSSGPAGAAADILGGAIEAPEKWDAAHVRDALTHAQYLLASFGMPRTSETVAAGARVVGALKAQADARLAQPHVASVDEIVRRLRTEAKQSAFAKETLGQLEGLPADLTRSVHALIVKASTLSLRECMEMEYRAFARLASGAVPANALMPTLSAPISESEGMDDMRLRERPQERAVRAARVAELDAWASKLAATYESGTADGAVGDVLRRRFKWFRAPHIGWDGEGMDAPAHSEEALAARDAELAAEALGDAASWRVGADTKAAVLRRSGALRRAFREGDDNTAAQ